MANVEINELPPAVSIDGTELIAIDKNTGFGYVTQKTSLNSLSSLGVTEPYVVAQVTVGLPNSRLLAGAGGQITVADGGAGGNISIGLAMNGVVAGTYGDSTHVARVTVDNTGRVSSVTQVSIAALGDVVGPASSVAGDIAIFSNTTGKLLSDSGKTLPAGAIVGTTDVQTLSNKSIDAIQLTGTVSYARLPVGTIANTVAAGDDSRIVNALNKNNNLSDVSNATASRTNIGAAASGANSDITSLTGLTTALSVSQGGTGATTSTGTGSVVLSNSPTFTGVVTIPSGASIAGYALLASPAFTGNPTAPTQSAGDNSTKLATTAYADGAVASGVANLKWRSRFIGEVVYANTAVTGAETPPSTTTDTVWIELTSGLTGVGQFNNGKLTSESVSGSAPLVLATAVISYAGSPMNGQTIRLINTESRILRPSISPGTIQDDAFQGHRHSISPTVFTANAGSTGTGSGNTNPVSVGDPTTDGVNGTPRTANETRMKNIGVKTYMRIA